MRYRVEQYNRGPIKVAAVIDSETGRPVREYAGRSARYVVGEAREHAAKMNRGEK